MSSTFLLTGIEINRDTLILIYNFVHVIRFHHVISLDDTVSINFWFEMGQVDPAKLVYPLCASQRMAVRRNIEKMIGTVLGPRVSHQSSLTLSNGNSFRMLVGSCRK